LSCPLSRKPVSVAALLVLGAGLAFTGILSAWLGRTHDTARQQELEYAADMRQTAFLEALDNTLDALTVVNRFFSSAGEPNRRQFQDLSGLLVERHPFVQAFAFSRVIPDAQRHAFEARMQRHHDGFVITEIRNGRTVPAGSRPQYHVIEQVAPAAPNALVVGLDINSVPGRERALDRARTAGAPSATGLFDLLTAGGRRGFVVFVPVYRPGAAREEANVAGYTAVVIRASALVESVMRRAALLQSRDVDVSILVDDGADKELVFRTGAAVPHGPAAVRSFETAGLRWHLEVSQPPSAVGIQYALRWIALAGGSALSILLALYLQSLAVRARDLARANARLKDDIAARKRIESALRASEERFQRLASMSSDWYWEQDADLHFTMISGDRIFGDTPTRELIGKARWDIPVEIDEKDFEHHLNLIRLYQPFTDLEYRVRDAKGREHWMSVSGEPMFGSDGEFLGYRGTGKDITERKESEQALRQSQIELRELAAHQARVKEDERKRIAREIHDDLGQNLLALRIDVSLLEDETRQRHPALNERIHSLLSQVDNVVRSVRTIINDLRPAVLDLGLQCAVEWQVQQFRQRSGVSCTLSTEGGDIDDVLDEEAATSIFRILQESLTNVSRHAYATHVDIRLQRRYDSVVLEIADDGVGTFPGNMRKPRSFGLIGIRERIYTMGGEFRVVSAPGKGTTLTITIPASQTSAAAA